MEQKQYRVSALVRIAHSCVLVGVCLISESCRKTVAPPQQPPPPTPIVVPRKEAPKRDVNLPAAPPIASKVPDKSPIPDSTKPPVLKPPAPKPARRPRVARKVDPKPKPPVQTPSAAEEAKPAQELKAEAGKPEVVAPAGSPEAAQPSAPVSPKLGQMLSPQESKEYTKRLDSTAERIRATVAAIQTKTLSDEQKEIVGRIRSFLAQAEQAREQDLINAVTLAERADLLSRDLLERLR